MTPERLSPEEQKILSNEVVREIRFTGDVEVWGISFRGFCDLKRKIESGKPFWLPDLQRATALYDSFEDAFGSDTTRVLDEWVHAQNRQKLAGSN